jgi:hypothetical protein
MSDSRARYAGRMLTRRGIPAVLAAVTLLATAGCSLPGVEPGPVVTRDRAVDDATAIVLTTPGELVISVGETPSLEVTAGENVIDTLTARVADGVLRLEGSRSVGPVAGTIRYELTLPRVDSITIEGSGSVRADLSGGQALTIDIKGSGDLHGENLAATSVTTVVEGSGNVSLAGTTTEQSVSIRGSGDFDGLDLASTTATVDIAGSGDVELTVSDRLRASIAGSGDIRHGGGAKVDGSIAGSGDISAL